MIDLRAVLERYTVTDGKEIAITMTVTHTADNLIRLASIGAGQPVDVKSVQEQLPLEDVQ